MKKILFFVIFLGFLANIDHTQLFALFESKDVEIVATVNDKPIYFAEIEALYDIKFAQKTIQAPRISELHREYASLLYTRIEQILVAQELENRNIEIQEERIEAFKKLVSQDHFDTQSHDNKTFKELVEETGVQYSTWEEQIRIRLQIETLQQEITNNIVLEPNEITQYVHEHPELATTSETYELILFKSNKKEDLAALKKEGIDNSTFIKEKEIQTLEGFFSIQNIPEPYQKPLENLEPHTFSEIISLDNGFEMLYIVKHKKTDPPTTFELYSMAEEALLTEKAEKAYHAWLEQALKNANIQIGKKFLPTKLPKMQIVDQNKNEEQDNLHQNLQKLTETDIIEP